MASPVKTVWTQERQSMVRFTDVMSEQYFEEFSSPADATSEILRQSEVDHDVDAMDDDEQIANDYQIALLLQQQTNLEHDEHLQAIEDKINRGSNVCTSLASFRLCDDDSFCRDHYDADEFSSDEDDHYGDMWYEFDERGNRYQVPTNFKSGVRMCAGRIITKHDKAMVERNNSKKIVDQFDTSFNCGDLGGDRISNHVYNQLKCIARADAKQSVRLREPAGSDWESVEKAIDAATHKILFKLVGNDRLRSISHIISTGKEAIIVQAVGGDCPTAIGRRFPQDCAIKVFKTLLKEFKHRRMYVTSDYRFSKNDLKKRQHSKKVVRIWAEKEAINLARMYKRGIPCPEPIMVRKHVLVMRLITANANDDGCPDDAEESGTMEYCRAAPTLHTLRTSQADFLSAEQWQKAFSDTLAIISNLYSKCQLVHADLSEYNLLWSDNRVFVIDVSQSVDIHHIYSYDFLRRDCQNVFKFFAGVCGCSEVGRYEDFFNDLTGIQLHGYDKEFMDNFSIFTSQRVQQKRNRGGGGKHLRRDFSDSDDDDDEG